MVHFSAVQSRLSAPTFRARVGPSVEWRFLLLGEGCQGTWGSGGQAGRAATVVQVLQDGQLRCGRWGGGVCPGWSQASSRGPPLPPPHTPWVVPSAGQASCDQRLGLSVTWGKSSHLSFMKSG